MYSVIKKTYKFWLAGGGSLLQIQISLLPVPILYIFPRKNIQGGEMRVSLVSSRSVEVEVELDNNMRELAYYSLEKGDTLLVRW